VPYINFEKFGFLTNYLMFKFQKEFKKKQQKQFIIVIILFIYFLVKIFILNIFKKFMYFKYKFLVIKNN